jgi:quinolinate synthase
MKKITLEKVAACLERMEPRVTVPEQIASRARLALDRMVAIAP